jgi:3-deoxy-manno-octulosonate cytidylyltransferase (CMP-KDO synthetase)
MGKKICVIPARLESSRFPNKILTEINGKNMFVAVYDIAIRSGLFDKVYVATHNEEVIKICEELNIDSIVTNSNHVCGSSRVFEAARQINEEWDIVVNLQADQPFLPVAYLESVLRGIKTNPISTIGYLDSDNKNPNTVKIILDKENSGIYFSRYPIPFSVNNENIERYCHLGLYAYKREFVESYAGNFQSALAVNESLEQLDFIYHGYKIDVELVSNPIPEVNVPEDIQEAKRLGLL